MNDLLETYNQLNESQRRQLLEYADSLLLEQKAKKFAGNLSKWKEKIKLVSTWTEEDISMMEEESKKMNQWKIPEW